MPKYVMRLARHPHFQGRGKKGATMEFPAYTPAAVRTYITTLIEGDLWEPMGLAESLASAERQLAEIEGAIATQTWRGAYADLDGLRRLPRLPSACQWWYGPDAVQPHAVGFSIPYPRQRLKFDEQQIQCLCSYALYNLLWYS